MILRNLILCIGFFCTTLSVLGQDGHSFRHLSKEDGLSQVSVFSIAQDPEGFLWFGTRNGLNRYDGTQFKVFKKDTSAFSLPTNIIRTVYVDAPTNSLWIGTNYGISKYDLASGKFKNYAYSTRDKHSISSNMVRRFFRDSKGRLWVGTANGINLYQEEDDQFKRFLFNNGSLGEISLVEGWTFLEDQYQELWVGTSNGLYKLVEKDGIEEDFQRMDGKNGVDLEDAYIRSLVEDEKGNFWIGFDHSGLNYWNRSTGEIQGFKHNKKDPNTLSNNQIRDLCLDADQNLWVATFNGLNFLQKGATQFKVYKKDKLNEVSITDNSIHSLFLDKRGSLWVGTFYGGVNHLNEKFSHFTNYKHTPFKNSLSVDVVSSFTEDKAGNFWIGTEGGGLNFFDPIKKEFKHYKSQPGNENTLQSDNIKKLFLDDNQLWIGTFQGGLSSFDLEDKTFKHFQHNAQDSNSISGDNIYDLYKGERYLWVLAYGKGLNVLDLPKNKVYHYRSKQNDETSICSDLVRTFLETRKKEVWIGTEQGLSKVRKDSLGLPLSFETLIPGERIYALQESWDEKIWIGTYSSGLYYFDPVTSEMEHFTTTDGLPGNSILGIVEISEEELWLSTNNGLSKFNYLEKSFTNYDLHNGLASLEYSFNAYYQARSGAVLFGGLNGFTIFHPADIQPHQTPPPVVFTELRHNGQIINTFDQTRTPGKTQKRIETVKFNHNEANFSIRFVALDFISPMNNQFAYKLEGIDRDWNYTIGKNEATYTIQKDGAYIFRLKGANSDGVWNVEEKQLKIVVLPPPWKTWWAYLLYLGAFGALIYGLTHFVRLRHKLQLQQVAKQKQDELHELKLQFFTNITHEFRTPLTLIQGPLKELISKEKHTERVEQKLKSIQSNTQRLLNLVNQVLTFRKLATDHEPLQTIHDNLIPFLKEIFLPFRETAELRSISYHFLAEQQELMVWYDPDKLEKVFFNLLSNAFKFTPDGGAIELRILAKESCVEIQVVDTGTGIEPALYEQIFKRFYRKSIPNRSTIKGTGIGLAISKQMVELHQGNIFVQKVSSKTTTPKGATFVVQLPLGKDHLKAENVLPFSPKADKIENYQALKEVSSEVTPAFVLEKGKQPSLLIVEDNAEICAYIQQVFEPEYQVITAEDGIEGLEKTKKHLPHLVISDVMMPRMDGIQFCSQLKSDLEISHIPVILLTARTASILKIEGLKTGADDYVTKPFDPEELRLRARNIIQARQEIRNKFTRILSFDPKEVAITSADEVFLENALSIAENNIGNYEFNVIQFAKDLAVSRPLLFTKLKALTGQTPNNFIKTIRLKRAAQLLKTQKLNVSEVAYQVGFKDPKYFRKCFKEQFKTVPSEYGKAVNT